MVESPCQPGGVIMPEDEYQPAYLRIQQDLHQRIDEGEWPPGRRLPTQQELAEYYGVSLQSIKTALNRLDALGVVILRRGGSAIVAERPD
jgi:DNA-binding GntR family transcriptional regulator